MSSANGPVRLIAQFDLSEADLDVFEAYETQVLMLLETHGGKLNARLRGVDRPFETHVLVFSSAAALRNYREDPRRRGLQPLFERSRARVDQWEVIDLI